VYGNVVHATTSHVSHASAPVQVLPGAGYPPLGAPPVDWTQWHVIGGTWNATAITFYVDDVPYETKTSADVILPTAPQVSPCSLI